MEIEIRRLGPGDEAAVFAAAHLLDGPPDDDATSRFLAEPTHHMLVAYDLGGRAVGFVSGIEITHPDKGTELLLYELGVDELVRRRGIGGRLVRALHALARELRCTSLWVLVDDDNDAALATYASAGARTDASPRLLEWDVDGPPAVTGDAPPGGS